MRCLRRAPKVVADFTKKALAGHGAVREAIELILKSKGIWEAMIDKARVTQFPVVLFLEELGINSIRAVRVPSEARPGKRNVIFELTSHNPTVVGSNPTPATMGAERQNLKPPFLV
jgi:hypothetical protein